MSIVTQNKRMFYATENELKRNQRKEINGDGHETPNDQPSQSFFGMAFEQSK